MEIIIKAFRLVGAIIVALLIAVISLAAVEFLGAIVHPFPTDFGNTTEEMLQHVARFPAWVLAMVVPVWGLIALITTWLATRTGGRGAGIFIALLLVAGVIFNVSYLPYPIWFKLVSVTVIVLASLSQVAKR